MGMVIDEGINLLLQLADAFLNHCSSRLERYLILIVGSARVGEETIVSLDAEAACHIDIELDARRCIDEHLIGEGDEVGKIVGSAPSDEALIGVATMLDRLLGPRRSEPTGDKRSATTEIIIIGATSMRCGLVRRKSREIEKLTKLAEVLSLAIEERCREHLEAVGTHPLDAVEQGSTRLD